MKDIDLSFWDKDIVVYHGWGDREYKFSIVKLAEKQTCNDFGPKCEDRIKKTIMAMKEAIKILQRGIERSRSIEREKKITSKSRKKYYKKIDIMKKKIDKGDYD